MRQGLENVSFSYGSQVVLTDFTMALPDQGIVCLFGPSGCGKSTVLRLLSGLEMAQKGRICGLEDRRIAYLFQENRLLPWCTAQENLRLVMGRTATTADAQRLLARVGIGDKADTAQEAWRYPEEMSGGMQRRVALARALAMPSDVLLLDEPLKELDEQNKRRLLSVLLEESTGKLMLVVTHDMQEAQTLGADIRFVDGPPLRYMP